MNLHSIIEAARLDAVTLNEWSIQTNPERLERISAVLDLTAAMLAVCKAANHLDIALIGSDETPLQRWIGDVAATRKPLHEALCALGALLIERGLTMGGDE